MDHKITFRLSDEEYDTLKMVARWHKNNKSKAIREIIQYYREMAIFTIPNRAIYDAVYKRPECKPIPYYEDWYKKNKYTCDD